MFWRNKPIKTPPPAPEKTKIIVVFGTAYNYHLATSLIVEAHHLYVWTGRQVTAVYAPGHWDYASVAHNQFKEETKE